jgi:hypothetical protein
MEATELRIGNLVTVDNEKCHTHLKGVTMAVVGISPRPDNNHKPTHAIGLEYINQEPNKYYESYSQFLRFIKPIPLTEEWLEKSEFVFDLNYREYDKGVHNEIFSGSICVKCRHGNSKYKWELCIGHVDIRYFNYVHELQNLIFTLTGEEL